MDNCPVNGCEKRLLVAALQEIIKCNDDFRAGMTKDWDGDLLQDAVDTARFLLVRIGAAVGSAPNPSAPDALTPARWPRE